MHTQENLIDQLEGALASKDIAKRAETLRRVTDLFAIGSARLSVDDVELFGDVMCRLVEGIELAARTAFGSRIAMMPGAPTKIVRLLAFDDAVEVAAPILTHSEMLDEQALVQNARTKSQGHLLAISGRKTLPAVVTDVLVDRGNPLVVTATAKNLGAAFSDFGFSSLVQKSKADGDLAMCVWSRPDIPRQDLVRLFVQASEVVRNRLEAADPRRAGLIRSAVAEASDEVQTLARVGSDEAAQAQSSVQLMHASGQLDQAWLLEFARARFFDKTTVALSLMCDLPVGSIERVMVQSRSEQLVVIAKAIGLSWETCKALLLFQAGRDILSQEQLDLNFTSFSRLQPKTAQIALQFYRLREKADVHSIH
jgi:uncharacterized protein (DUF2336 family)